MNTRENTKAISEIAASQMGLLTSAQAASFNVSRNVLAYMTKVGRLERLEHGVYRIGGTPHDANQAIYAAWLSTNPTKMAHERRLGFDSVVVGGRSAAAMHGIGDFFLSPYRFLTHRRINSKRSGIIFTKRPVDRADVVFTDFGLPVTSVTRTVFDLSCDGEDPSLLFRVLSDAMKNRSFDAGRLVALFEGDSTCLRGFDKHELEDMMNAVRG